VLGRGGFATVYRARQLTVDRDVALKILDGAPTDERTLQLFTRECRAAGSLSWHPHVVVVHDAGTTPRGAPYLAMELLPGGSVADALAARGPLEPETAVRVAAEVASALAAAHEMDLLHRDVKPANVLIDRLGRAKLADFGIARLVGAGSATATGAVTGTVAYMAPEVLQGGKATPASDVYALGLTLLTCFAGRNPLTAESDDSPFAVIARVVSGAPLDVPATVSPELRALIEACTARHPAARPSAAETETALAAIATGSAPRPAPPASRPASPSPPEPPAVADRAAATAPPAPVAVDPPAAGPPRSGPAIPPPPTSAVRVRADHTLAEPPPPPADLDPTVAAGGGTQVAPAPPPGRRGRRLAVPAFGALALVLVAAIVAALVLAGDDDPSADPTTTTADPGTATTGSGSALDDALLTAADIGSAWSVSASRTETTVEDLADPGCTDVELVDAVALGFQTGPTDGVAHSLFRLASEADATRYVDQLVEECEYEPLAGVAGGAVRAEHTDAATVYFRVGDVVGRLYEVRAPGTSGVLTVEAGLIDTAVAKLEAL